VGEREITDGSGGGDSGGRGEFVEESVEEGRAFDAGGVTGIQANVHGDSGLGEAGRNARDVAKAAKEKTCSGEKDEDKRDLNDDESAAEAVACVKDTTVYGGFEEFDGVEAGERERWEGSKEKAGKDGDAEGEEEDGGVEGGLVEAGDVARVEAEEKAKEDVGKGDAEDACGEAEEEGLGEELSDDASATSSEDGANSKFMSATGGACEEKIGGVATCDEEYEENGSEEKTHERAHGADGVVVEGFHQGAVASRVGSVETVDAGH
jgi:hypothetical protein